MIEITLLLWSIQEQIVVWKEELQEKDEREVDVSL